MKRRVLSFVVLLAWVAAAVAQQPATAPKSSAAHHAAAHAAPSAEQIWTNLMAGNKRFVAGKPMARQLPALRDKLSKGQQPRVAVLACSDSRVAPETIFDQTLGDLFVVRSAGNIADAIGVGSLEYAVEHLGSTVIVVIGHTKCGAVTAACSGEKMPSSNLQRIVDKISPAAAKASQSAKPDDVVEEAIKENVHQSAKDVLANSEILQHFVADGKLKVIEAEYNITTGEITRLDVAGKN